MGSQFLCAKCRKEMVICASQNVAGVGVDGNVHYLGVGGALDANKSAKLCSDGSL